MCGIAGIIGLRDKGDATTKIKRLANTLAHRGPDAEGFFIDDRVALAHRRLSIIDLSETANQPLFDVTGRYCIILNGEIYNYREVKSSFSEYPFRTESDTEVVLAAYVEHGTDCLSLFNGMFALAIWDSERRELFVARDRLGVKPLYYSQTADGVFVFASEIRAILDSELIPRHLSKNGLYEYLMYQSVYSPRTIVENIFQLPAGEFGLFRDSKFEKWPFWQIDKTTAYVDIDESEVKKNVKELLLRSVERRMVSDVRLGAFLSGGIDSSAVVALMSEVSEQPIDTFSVFFGEREFDESRYSNLIAQKYNTRHTGVVITPGDLLAELPSALKAVDSPSGDGINTYVVSKATKRSGLKVALSGLGGDELFAGYPNFLRWLKLKKGIFPKIPTTMRKSLAFALSASKRSKAHRSADILRAEGSDISDIYSVLRQVMSKKIVDDLSMFDKSDNDVEDLLRERASSIDGFPLFSQFTIAELLGYTQNVLLKDTDQFSMASALEVREPFFDYELVEYVLRIPDKIKFPKYPKSLLVESIAPMLPDEIVHRKKMGFVFPWEKWMRNELKVFCRSSLGNLAERGIVDGGKLMSKWDSFLNYRDGVLSSHLWHMVVLSAWLDNNGF